MSGVDKTGLSECEADIDAKTDYYHSPEKYQQLQKYNENYAEVLWEDYRNQKYEENCGSQTKKALHEQSRLEDAMGAGSKPQASQGNSGQGISAIKNGAAILAKGGLHDSRCVSGGDIDKIVQQFHQTGAYPSFDRDQEACMNQYRGKPVSQAPSQSK